MRLFVGFIIYLSKTYWGLVKGTQVILNKRNAVFILVVLMAWCHLVHITTLLFGARLCLFSPTLSREKINFCRRWLFSWVSWRRTWGHVSSGKLHRETWEGNVAAGKEDFLGKGYVGPTAGSSWAGGLHPPGFRQVPASFPGDRPRHAVSEWEVALVVALKLWK